jgi:hypothetical protein
MRTYFLTSVIIAALTLAAPSDARAQFIMAPAFNGSYVAPANYYSYSPGYIYPAAYSYPAYSSYVYGYPAYSYPVSTYGYTSYSYPAYYRRGLFGWRRW